VGFLRKMRVGAGGIVYANVWAFADMIWTGKTWVEWAGLGGKFPLSSDGSGRTDISQRTIQSSIGRYDIKGGRGKQPVDGWMGNDSFFSRPSLFLYIDDGCFLYDLILPN